MDVEAHVPASIFGPGLPSAGVLAHEVQHVDALVAAGIDPSGMPAFFETMSKQAADRAVAFASTHPSSADREAALRERLSAATTAFTPLSFGAWPPR